MLGAVPMGWLADRVKRVPIVGWASLAFGFFVFMSGLAISAFMLFWTRFATGIAKANSIPVHQSLIADNYPIGIRARMSAAINMGGHGIGLISPVICAGIATWAGGVEGWRWAWFLLGIPVVCVALLAFRMKEPPRGQFEKQDVLGEVIEDEQPAPISMEAAFARIKRIRTIRTVLVGFCALGFGLFSQPAHGVALPRREPPREGCARARDHPQPLGHPRPADPAARRPLLRPQVPRGPGARPSRSSGC